MWDSLHPLLIAAASIGFLHTIAGPDHYLPFIAMSRARRWSLAKTAWLTALCGVGHVAGSILLGAIGIAAGVVIHEVVPTEDVRGDLAAWALTAFGLVYLVWGLRRAWRNRPHTHRHLHPDEEHEHEHAHTTDHAHVHTSARRKSLTPWVLFLIFVLGPCEPLIPLLMYPAVAQGPWGVALVAAVFGSVTVATMLGVVLLMSFGVSFAPLQRLERYMHAMAGAMILACGIAIHVGL